ncbi:MAG: hypothetical protein ABIJ45_01645 [Candidatus Zixiibacteriota bacterium]
MIKRIVFILSILFILVSGANGNNVNRGTIVTKDRERIENVEYLIDNSFMVIIIKSEKRNISFHNIDSIYNENGNEIWEISIKSNDPDIRVVRKPWKLGLSLGINTSFSMGSTYNDFFKIDTVKNETINSIVGFDAIVMAYLGKGVSLRGAISKSGLDYLNNNLDVWKYQLSLQYMPVGTFSRRFPVSAFSYIGIGLIDNKFEINNNIESKMEPSLHFGGGGEYSFSRLLNIYMSGELNLFKMNVSNEGNELTFILDIKFGLSFFY